MSYLPSSRLYDSLPEPRPRTASRPPVVAEEPPIRVEPEPELLFEPPPAPKPRPKERMVIPAAVAPPEPIRVETRPIQPTVVEVPRPVSRPTMQLPASFPTMQLPASFPSLVSSETAPAPDPIPETPPPSKAKISRDLFQRAHKVVLRHIDKAKHSPRMPKEPDILYMLVMGIGSMCMGLMIWGAYSALPRWGIGDTPLRVTAGGPKLKVTSEVPVHWIQESRDPRPDVKPFVPPLMPPAAPPLLVAPTVPMVHVPPPAPKIDLPPVHLPEPPIAVEKPLDPLPERREPVVFVHANLGETPMIRTWKKLADYSLLLAALTLPPANPLFAQGLDKVPIPPPQPAQPAVDYSKQIDALTKAIEALRVEVNNFKLDEKLASLRGEMTDKIAKMKAGDSNLEFQLLSNRLDVIEKAIAKLATTPSAPIATGPAPAVDRGGIDDIRNKLGSIEQAILKLQPAEKRIALAPPATLETPPVTTRPAVANVILVNLYDHDLWLWVNQKPYRVPANTTKTLDNVPVGAAEVEIRSPEGVFHRSTPNLVAGETFTLTAR